jgi:hypothetical protein
MGTAQIEPISWELVAAQLSKDEFVERFPSWFFVTKVPLWTPKLAGEPTEDFTTPRLDGLYRRVFMLPLPGASMVVGRDTEAGMVIYDRTISRRHAEILNDGHTISVRDLGSKHGTRIDGRRVGPDPLPLQPEVIVSFAYYEFRVVTSEAIWRLVRGGDIAHR